MEKHRIPALHANGRDFYGADVSPRSNARNTLRRSKLIEENQTNKPWAKFVEIRRRRPRCAATPNGTKTKLKRRKAHSSHCTARETFHSVSTRSRRYLLHGWGDRARASDPEARLTRTAAGGRLTRRLDGRRSVGAAATGSDRRARSRIGNGVTATDARRAKSRFRRTTRAERTRSGRKVATSKNIY